MRIKTTMNIVTKLPKSGSLQWAIIGTTILTTLIAYEDTLTLIAGEAWGKAIILGASIINGVIIALNRNNTTKPLEEL